jgi:hypothetical protein
MKLALVSTMLMLTGCALNRPVRKSVTPTYKFDCDVLAHDAKTGKPSMMNCNHGDIWKRQAEVAK